MRAASSPAPAALPGLSQSQTSSTDNKPLISGSRQGRSREPWGVPSQGVTAQGGTEPAGSHPAPETSPSSDQLDSPARRLLRRPQHFGSDFSFLFFDCRLHCIQEEAGNSVFVQQLPGEEKSIVNQRNPTRSSQRVLWGQEAPGSIPRATREGLTAGNRPAPPAPGTGWS